MQLKELRISGFKSFADKTSVSFAPGVTTIVGPNGCGKSNIIDAVRWVLGEQRARILRSEKMDNLIFNGSKGRKKLGLAEVFLTIENTKNILPTEYAEVTIGRRLYRSGESDYLLNGQQCRLKDIMDLFMDTGMGAGAYSVIELKMVEEILSDNADDRRRMFEEAAGITKYKKRRHQALKRLDTTKADLTRLNDLIDEIDKQVRSLKRQAKKAAKAKEYNTELSELEIHSAVFDYNKLVTDRKTVDSDVIGVRDLVAQLTATEAQHESRLEEIRVRLLSSEQDLAEKQIILNEARSTIQAMEADIRFEQERIRSADQRLIRMEHEEKGDKKRSEGLSEKTVNIQKLISDVKPKIEAAQSSLDQARAKRDETQKVAEEYRLRFRETVRLERESRGQLQVISGDIDRREARTEIFGAQIEQMTQRQLNFDFTVQERSTVSERSGGELKAAQDTVYNSKQKLEEMEDRYQQLRQDSENHRDELYNNKRVADTLATEIGLLESLVAAYEGEDDAVRFLTSDSSWSANTPSTVLDVFQINPEHRAAIGTLLGSFASCFVVDNRREAQQAISKLRGKEAGRATFIVLDELHNLNWEPRQIADATPAIELVSFEAENISPLARTLLQNAYLVSSLDEAQKLAAEFSGTPGKLLFVAPNGEWADTEGKISGGSVVDESAPGMARMEKLDRLEELKGKLAEAEKSLSGAEGKYQEIVQALENLPLAEQRAELRQSEIALSETEKEYSQATFELDRIRQNQSEIRIQLKDTQANIQEESARIKELKKNQAELTQQVVKAEKARSKAESDVQRVEVDERVSLESFSEADIHLVRLQNEYDNLNKDLVRIEQTRTEIEDRKGARATELESLMETKEQARKKSDSLAEDIKGATLSIESERLAVTNAETTVSGVRAEVSELEKVLRDTRRQKEETMREESTRASRLVEINTRLDSLMNRAQEELSLNLAENEVEMDPEFDVFSARSKIGELKSKLRNLGAVNELALESFEEEKERLQFLTEQRQDLAEAEASLISTIDEINETASARFHETFKLIKANFSDLFNGLFGGDANARVDLVDPSDPLESPIEIMARPSGKKNVALSQLSGGEKTLTAVSLLFAIYMVKPSPFCILDEVDAPLDDSNVGHFMSLLRRFSDSTQFVLVTHNKLSMRESDRMYGITQQEDGVSKLVGVSLEKDKEAA